MTYTTDVLCVPSQVHPPSHYRYLSPTRVSHSPEGCPLCSLLLLAILPPKALPKYVSPLGLLLKAYECNYTIRLRWAVWCCIISLEMHPCGCVNLLVCSYLALCHIPIIHLSSLSMIDV